MNLLEDLNKEQLEAVLHQDGPVMIVAGAGTGKTTVITQRIAYLIEQGKAASEEILALTFTEKAAGEMEERVDRLLPMGYTDLWISTFHSFGERLLKDYGHEIGLPGAARLLNEFDQFALIKKNIDLFDLDYYRPLGNPTKFIKALTSHFSRLKDEDISPPQYLEYADELRQNLDNILSGAGKTGRKKQGINKLKSSSRRTDLNISGLTNADGDFDQEIAAQEVARISEVANAYHTYQQLLLDNEAMDFGDLINYALKLMRERPRILDKFRQQFKFVLLDEFQDTNWAQYELVKLLVTPKNNLFVVGDDDQSIYKFRGASVANILEFRRDFPKAKEIVLTKNYRNRQNILDLAYDFIQLNNPNRLECQEKSQKSKVKSQNVVKVCLNKKLKSQNREAGVIEVREGADMNQELKAVAERIAEIKIKNKDISWSDFGILVRANESAKEMANILEASGLPYTYYSSRGLYAKAVIMDTVAYLKLLDNYHESASVYRVLNMPVFGFSTPEIVNFNFIAGKKAWSLYTALKDSNGRLGQDLKKKVDKLLAMIDKHTSLARTKNVSEIFLAFLNDSGYLKYITGLKEAQSLELISYLNQFRKRIERFEAGAEDKSVKAFLDEFSVEIEAGEQGQLAPDIEAGPDTIKVMTVHAAKGLEFKHVFLPGLVDKRFPSVQRRDPIDIPEALIKEAVPEGDMHLEEERRLFYVALTRAREGLYLSWAKDYGGARLKKASRFLIEAGLLKNERGSSPTISKNQGKDLKRSEKVVNSGQLAFEPPNYFSFSKLTAFQTCPYQYRFSYILKVPTRNKHYFSFGKTMHSTLQKIFGLVNEKAGMGQGDLFAEKIPSESGPKEVLIGETEAFEIYKASWIDDWYLSAKQKEEYKEKGRGIIREFLKINNGNWPQALFLEKGFKNKIKDGDNIYTLGGTIDRIDEAGQALKIVDYKTGSPKEKLGFDDKLQLFIYQIALRELYKKEIKSLAFYYLENNSEIEFLGSEEDLAKAREKILKTIHDIRQGEFPPKPGPLCRHCDYFDICEFRKL